jgi:hypothetical protein
MVPDTKTLLAFRALSVGLIRLASLLFIPAGLVPLASWLMEGLRDDDLFWWSYYYERIVTGGLFILGGVLCFALARPLSRLAVPIRPPRWPPRCPACRYRLVTLARPICPECGLPLPEEFVADSAKPEGQA